MSNKEKITNQNALNIKNMVINKRREKNKTFNHNFITQNAKNRQNFDLVSQKYNNTFSFNKSKYIKFFSSFITNEKILRKIKNIRKNKTELFSDKIIQTQSHFFNVRKAFINNIQSSVNSQKNIKLKNACIPNRNKLNIVHIPSVSKPTSINKSINFPNKIIPKNRVLSNKNINTRIKPKNKVINYNLIKRKKESKSYIISNRHHNLLNINGYSIKEKKQPNLIDSYSKIPNETNIPKLSIMKRISFKKIKYPLFNNEFRNIKIIDKNNEHLLEKIYKNQTVSNFNNKYNLKFKTNDSMKKERVKILFSLLKKYKNSEKEKSKLFLYYNKFNPNMKYNI